MIFDFLMAHSRQLPKLSPVSAPHSHPNHGETTPAPLSAPGQISAPAPPISGENCDGGHVHASAGASATGGIALGCSCCAHVPVAEAARSHGADGPSRGRARLSGFDRAARSEAALGLGAFLGAVGWLIALARDTAAGHNPVSVAFYLAVVLVGGWSLLRGAARAWQTRALDMNALMSAAVIGACALGEWGEAAALVWLYALADKIEKRSLSRARDAITSLLSLAPSRVLVRRGDAETDAGLVEIPADAVGIGEIFVTRAGERIALDGALLSPLAQLDESPVTGEALPVEKRAGAEVLAGTLNVGDALEARALRPASQGTSARIARLVEEAGAHASPRQQKTERFARFYTPLVFGGAILVALVPPLFFGQAWQSSIYRALALLVAACPCAFVLSGPVATWCALATLSRRGVLVRGGAALESLAAARSFAFDKTGTLTVGAPVVTDFVLWRGAGLTREELIALAAGLEARSTHPLARAVLDFAAEHGIAPATVAEASERRGIGVRGILNGERFRVERWDENPENHGSGEVFAAARALREAGRSLALLSRENGAARENLAVLGFSDQVRPGARRALDELRRLGVKTLVLSGDHERAVANVAREVGAGDWRASLKPEEKLGAVRELERGGAVAMVGDGINDAPALAGASVGIAMAGSGNSGSGGRGEQEAQSAGASDIALEAAGVALLRDDLRLLPVAVGVARRTGRIISGNIALALGLKSGFVLGVLLGVWGHDYLVGGVISDVGASLLVTLNGLRLLGSSSKQR